MKEQKRFLHFLAFYLIYLELGQHYEMKRSEIIASDYILKPYKQKITSYTIYITQIGYYLDFIF